MKHPPKPHDQHCLSTDHANYTPFAHRIVRCVHGGGAGAGALQHDLLERGQRAAVERGVGDLGGAELEHQELLELPRRRRTAARRTMSRPRARRGCAPRPPGGARHGAAAARTCHTAQHGASWASPTAEGACRAGTRPRVCSAASRTHAPRCGVNALPLSASTWPTQPSRSRGHTPQSGARMRPRGHDAREHTACGPPSATRPPPAGREGQGQAPSQARPDRARHGPVRTRVRVTDADVSVKEGPG